MRVIWLGGWGGCGMRGLLRVVRATTIGWPSGLRLLGPDRRETRRSCQGRVEEIEGRQGHCLGAVAGEGERQLDGVGQKGAGERARRGGVIAATAGCAVARAATATSATSAATAATAVTSVISTAATRRASGAVATGAVATGPVCTCACPVPQTHPEHLECRHGNRLVVSMQRFPADKRLAFARNVCIDSSSITAVVPTRCTRVPTAAPTAAIAATAATAATAAATAATATGAITTACRYQRIHVPLDVFQHHA